MLRLSSESVEGASLALEGVDNVHGSDGLAASVLRVGDGVADDVLEKHLCKKSFKKSFKHKTIVSEQPSGS